MTDAFQQDYWQNASRLGPLRAVIDPRDRDGTKNRSIHEHHQRQTRAFLDRLPLARGRPVLDLGCGTGRHRELLESYGRPCLGLDRSPGMLTQAHPPVACADLLALPVRDRSIALAFAFWVFQHLTDDADVRRAADGLRRATAPDGLLVFTERAGAAASEPGQDPRYIHHRQPDHYRRLFEGAGWTLHDHRVMPPHAARPRDTQEIQYAFAAHA